MNDHHGDVYPQAAAGAPPSKRRSALRWMAALLASLVALLLGLLTLLLIGFETGPVPFLVGLIVAVLPVPVYVTLVVWVDRYESEPLWMLATAFLWGAAVAVFFAILVNSLGQLLVGYVFGAEAATLYGTSISAPVVEEGAKALALFVLFFWRRDEFDGVIDGIVYAAMVGLGFAMTENILYYGRAAAEGSTLATFIIRGMFAPFAHPLFTAMTGIGLGLASQTRRRAVKLFAPACGLLLAMALHSLWNTSLYVSQRLGSGLIALAMYFLVMVPVFIGLLITVALALRREGRVLREHLRADLGRGWLTEEELERLCSVRGRMHASLTALTSGGVTAWRARRRFHSLASELAFHRSRVLAGVHAGDAAASEREEMYTRLLGELRGRMR